MNEIKRIRFHTNCDCACGGFAFEYFEDDNLLAISTYQLTFFTKQDGIFRNIWNRIRFVWYALIGKEYVLYEGIFSEKEIISLRQFFNSLEV